MATNNSPFNKVSAPRSADEYLKELEDLMKLNRGGGLLIGYDTDSNKPIYLPGKVANPTGLEGYASKTALNLPTLPQMESTQSVPEMVPNFGDMNVGQLLDYGSTADIAKLTPEQLTGLFDAIDFQNNNIQQNLSAPIDNPNYSAPTSSDVNQNPTPSPTSVNPLTGTSQDALSSQTPMLPPQGSGTGNADTMWNIGWNTGYNNPDTLYAGNDVNEKSGYEKGQQEYLNRKPTLDFNEYQQSNQNTLNNADQILNTPERDFTKNPATQEEIYASGGRGLARTQALNLGLTEDQLNANNNLNLETIKNERSQLNPIKTARQALGNFVEGVGDAIPGVGEHNISEWIAGGPTKHTGQVKATGDINVSEPSQTDFQAGAGIQGLQKGIQPGAIQQSTRPPISSINPAAPVIGNFAGIPASAVQSASKGMSQTVNNPAQMNPIQPPTVNTVTNQSINRPAVYSAPSNNQQSNNNQQSSSNQNNQPSSNPSPAPTSSYKAPTTSYKAPVATPTKYIPPKQPIPIPLATYGVGSVSPAPAPKPASSNNVFSSVFNAIKNLFKRR